MSTEYDDLTLGAINLNSGEIEIALDGLDFSAPAKRIRRLIRSVGHGSKPLDAFYENAIRKIALIIKSSTKDAVFAHIRNIIAELEKETTTLEFQPRGATYKSFTTIYGFGSDCRTDYNWYFANKNTAWLWLQLEGEPFWRSDLKTTSLGATTLPASFVFSSILGDVETSSQLRFKLTSATSLAKCRIGRKITGNPAAFVCKHEAESMTLNSGTTSEADAGASNGYRIARPPTGTWTWVAEEALLLATYKGTYKIYVRAKTAVAGKSNILRGYSRASSTSSQKYCEDKNGVAVTVTVNSDSYKFYELGEITLPHTDVTDVMTINDWRFGFEVRTDDGAPDNIWIDYYSPLPTDDQYIADVDAIAQNDYLVLDSLGKKADCWLLKAVEQTSGQAIKNFVGKIAGSMVENKNQAHTQQATDDPLPSDPDWAEDPQADYDAIEADDGTNCTETTTPATGGDTDLTTDTTPMSASSYIDAQHHPNELVDNVVGEYWVSAVGDNTPWAKADLGNLQPIDKVRLYRPIDTPITVSVYTSTNDIDWTNQGSFQSGGAEWAEHTFTIINARYVRFDFSARKNIGEIEIRLTGSYYASPTRKPKKLTFDVSDILGSGIQKLTPMIEACGSGNNGGAAYGVKARIYNKNTSVWDDWLSNTATVPTDMTGDITDWSKYITNDQKCIMEVWPTYPSTSPGTSIHSQIVIDEAKLTVTHLAATESGRANASGAIPRLNKGTTALVVIPEEASQGIGLSNQMSLEIKYYERYLYPK